MTSTVTEIMDVTEAAVFLKVSVRTVREMARKGELPGRKVGKEWRFSRSGLIQWFNGRDTEQSWFWTEDWQSGEREADKDIAAGRVYGPKPGESAVEALHRLATEIDD